MPHCRDAELGSGVPPAVVSTVVRHSQLPLTSDLYGQPAPEIVTSGADVFGATLDVARAERLAECSARKAPEARGNNPETTLRASLVRETRRPVVVRRQGLEPRTRWLRASCSAS